MIFHLDGQGPLYEQLTRALRDRIRSGALAVGFRLPGSRRIARSLGISRNVVLGAFDQLILEGYLEARGGSGTYVADALSTQPEKRPRGAAPQATGWRVDESLLSRRGKALVDEVRKGPMPVRADQTIEFDFQYGLVEPDATSVHLLRKFLSRSLDAGQFDYGQPAGLESLRSTIAQHLNAYRGLRVSAAQIVVVSGSQQALDLTARLLLSPGDQVLIEEPQYQGARQSFRAAGARLQAIPVDANGIRIGADTPPAKLIYSTPSHQFPTGAVVPLARRYRLLDWAAKHRALVLEDDYDSEFRYDSRPVEAVAGLCPDGPVIYSGTFAKSLFPGLRLGFLAVPPKLVKAFTHAKWLSDRACSTPIQSAVAQFMAEGHYRRHLRRMNLRYRQTRQALVEALSSSFGEHIRIQGTHAGIHLVVWFDQLPASMEPLLVREAAKCGCAVYPISSYYIYPRALEAPGLILGYSALKPDDMATAVARLRAAWSNLTTSSHRQTARSSRRPNPTRLRSRG